MAATHTLQNWAEGPPPERDDGTLAIVELKAGCTVDGQPHFGHPIIVSRWSSKLKTTAGGHRLEYGDVLKHIEISQRPLCKVCGRVLDDEGDPVGSRSCGGDCCRCMASFGDDDCYRAMHSIEPDRYPLDSDGQVP